MRSFSKYAAVTTFAALMLCPMAFAQKSWDAPRIVTWNCSGCHGVDGNTQLSYFPRLAGLNTAYFEKRIAEFRESRVAAGGRTVPSDHLARFPEHWREQV